MDPLSAFALAGTVYTFIDAGITAIKFGKELRNLWKSSRDTTEDVGQLTVMTQNLAALSGEMRDVNEPQYLKTIATECSTLCHELVGLLENLKVKDKSSRFEHFRVVFSAYRRKDKISSIEEKLEKLRAQMTLDLLRMMKDGQSDVKKALDEVQDNISEFSATHSEFFRKQRKELLDLLQASEKNAKDHYSAMFSKLQEFQSGLLDERIQNQILHTLHFDGMYSREDSTSEPTEGTFQWLLSKDEQFEKDYVRDSTLVNKMQVAREAFLTWLQSGQGVFHVCGKAGSGKSTLMKLVCRDKQTLHGLNNWAGDKTLLYASFFFYDPGEKKTKSLEGLYQCVLFTILNKHRDLIKKVYPDEFDHDRQPSLRFSDLVRPQKLEKAIQSLITMTIDDSYKMCIFIDGLDEYEGSSADHWQLADRLRDWADENPNAKFCVSSRPEVQFVKTFGSDKETIVRQIHLQEFTRGDIERHCHDQFAKSSWFKSSYMVSNYDKFIDRIVARSQGVFLWAVLVTKLLLYEARKDGFERDLWRTLEEIPDGINELYQKLFDSLGEAQRRKCHRILLTVLTNPFEESLNIRSLNWIFDEEDLDHISLQKLDKEKFGSPERQVSRVIDNLSEWTRGLVETITWRRTEPSSTFHSSRADDGHSDRFEDPSVGGDSFLGSVGYRSDDQDTNEFIETRAEEGFLRGDLNYVSLQNFSDMIQQQYPVLVNGGRRTIERSPLFTTRVRLFHRTVKDYMLEPARFCQLQSDFPEFDVVNTHAKLRLLEIGSLSDQDQVEYSTDLHDYAYSILRMNIEQSLGTQTQVSWSVCKAIGLLFPTKGFCRPSQLHGLFNPPIDPAEFEELNHGKSRLRFLQTPYERRLYERHHQTHDSMDEQWFTGYTEAMSFAHFAAFFGYPGALDGQNALRSLPGQMKDEALMGPERNLLLSACLGRIILSGFPIHSAGSGSCNIIRRVLDLGCSGHDLARLEGPLEFELGKGATVWQLLIFALGSLEPVPSQAHMPSSVDQLLKVLAQLLEFEPQEEVLILVCHPSDKLFHSYITIRDAVKSLRQSDARDSIIRQLDSREQSTLEEPQSWIRKVFEVHNPLALELREDLRRLSPCAYSQWGKDKRLRMRTRMADIAVVSRTTLLSGSSVSRAILTIW